ncbi:MAG TPA: lysophospholipid acyltransferase family protein [Spirochaetia bacterium]|nr:lysophospholipid acyltransferase family protein [Spirochaetia bacterium]
MRILILAMAILLTLAVEDLRIRALMIVSIRAARSYLDHRAHWIARRLFAIARCYQDFRVIIDRGRTELPRQFLLIANHQSLIDIPVLIYSFPRHSVRFVGKKELFRYITLISVMLRVQQHARIDRKRNFAEATRQLELLGRRAMRAGFCPLVFPEGHRSDTGAVAAFHSGAVRTILRTAALPVVTVAVEGGDRAARLLQLRTNLHHLRYRVKVLSIAPSPTTKREIDDILHKARREIAEQLADWRGEPIGVDTT